MVEHGAHPEPGNTERSVLDVLHVASRHLDLFVVLIIEFLGTSLKLLDQLIRGCLLSSEDKMPLLVDLLVKLVILELELAIELLILLVDDSFFVLLE